MLSPSFSDVFKEGSWKETADFMDPCLQGLASRLQKHSLSCQRRRQLLRTLTIERSRDGKTLLSEEVLNIRMNHIHFHEGSPFGMIIKVEKSNTDQLRQGHQVVIA